MPYDDGRKGRFKADDTAKKWLVRYLVTIAVLVHLFALAVVVGVWHLVT